MTTDGARPGGAVIEELARDRLGFGRLRPGQLRAAEARYSRASTARGSIPPRWSA